MNSKKAILGFQFTERIKSQLFLAASTSSAVMGMQGEQAEGAFVVLKIIVGAIANDMHLASRMLEDQEKIAALVKDIDQVISRLDIRDFQDINARLGRIIAQINSLGQGCFEYLVANNLL